MSRRGDFRHSLAPPECVNSKQEVDLVDVDGGDPSRVTLQGEEAARVLQTVNLQPEGEESAFGCVGGGGGGAARRWAGRAALTRTVWSWLPVTTLPAAARSTVMGFWWAHCTERVSWQLMTSSLL